MPDRTILPLFWPADLLPFAGNCSPRGMEYPPPHPIHVSIGGSAGAAIAHAGFESINWSINGGISLTLVFILLAPIIGMIISVFITLVTIQRNFWLKMAIIVTTLTACFVFIHFKKPFEFWALLTLGVIFI